MVDGWVRACRKEVERIILEEDCEGCGTSGRSVDEDVGVIGHVGMEGQV